MPSIIDPEFGEITVTKRAGTRSIRIRMANNGTYTATAPRLTPLWYIRQVVDASRDALRAMAKGTSLRDPYQDGQAIGKQHKLAVITTSLVSVAQVTITRSTLIVRLPPGVSIDDMSVQQLIRDKVIMILRREAKATLPTLLAQLAREHGFHYERVRFSHATSRWGSCSSTGTISLNIALMKLPDQLIRYVLIHELCHTRYMDHSDNFWHEVEQYDPRYRMHRKQIAQYSPSV